MLCVHSMDHISYHHMLMLESVNRNRVVAVAVAFVRLSFLVDHFIAFVLLFTLLISFFCFESSYTISLVYGETDCVCLCVVCIR